MYDYQDTESSTKTISKSLSQYFILDRPFPLGAQFYHFVHFL